MKKMIGEKKKEEKGRINKRKCKKITEDILQCKGGSEDKD
jgi:hypothetical protein